MKVANKMTEKKKLYQIRTDIKCKKCNSKGAVKFFGSWDSVNGKISYACGPGGTIPWNCLNCGNTGLIMGTMECYKHAFDLCVNPREGERNV